VSAVGDDILLKPRDTRLGGSSALPLARISILGRVTSDKLYLISILWWRASKNKTANTYIIDIPR
jgi:hypothetical protein